MSVKVNVLASWTSHVLSMVVGFFLMPYIIHTVGDRSYGTWVFLNAGAGYTGLLYLGFGETISRYVSQHFARKEWDRLNEVVTGVFAAYFVSGSIAMIGGLLCAAIAPWIRDWDGESLSEVRWVMMALGLSAGLSIMGSVFGGVLYGIQRFDIERSILIVGMVTKLLLTLLLLSNEHSLITLAVIFLVHTSLEQVMYFIAARRLVPTLRIRPRFLKWAVIKDSYGFAALSGIGLVAAKLIYDTDYIVIGMTLGSAAIVPYAIGSRLCELIRKPILQIGDVFLPRASELKTHANMAVLQSLACKGMGLAFLLSTGLFIGGYYFGQMLIDVWMGDGYEESYLVFLILIGAQITAAPSAILHMTLVGTGDVRVPSLLRMAQAVMNLVLSLLLVKPFGIVGVAVGTMLPILIVDFGVLLPYGIRRLQMSFRYFLRYAIAPHVPPLAALGAYSYCISSFEPAASWTSILVITACGGLVLMGTAGVVWLLENRADVATRWSRHAESVDPHTSNPGLGALSAVPTEVSHA